MGVDRFDRETRGGKYVYIYIYIYLMYNRYYLGFFLLRGRVLLVRVCGNIIYDIINNMLYNII